MKLTKFERWVLSNQFRILEALYPQEAKAMGANREALECGYEYEYREMSQHIYDDKDSLDEKECMEVINILSMFRAIHDGMEKIKDITDIDEFKSKFSGFDGNGSKEGSYLSYARYFCEKGDRFAELKQGNFDFNSHMPMLRIYRPMLEEWNKVEKKYELSKEDIMRITQAKAEG